MTDLTQSGFRLGACSVDPKLGRIERPDGIEHVAPKAMEVLLCLAQRPGELVERDELIRAGWGDDDLRHEEALTRYIAELRHALGDRHDHPEYIQTIPRRGYRLVAQVTLPGAEQAVPEQADADAPAAGFWEEIKRRDVVRTSIAYAAIAWLLIEVASVIAPIFDIDPWFMRVLVIMAVIGFPIVVALSWAVQKTPEGLALDMPVVEGAPAPSIMTSRKVDMIIIVTLVIAVSFLLYRELRLPPAPPDSSEYSIAVLPFDNLSDSAEDEYLGDGLAEELLNLLAQTEHLDVTARKASFFFKDKDVSLADIVETLGVRNIVEGSVQRSGDRIRITVQLIDGLSLQHRWADSYDTSEPDLIRIRDTVAREVVTELKTVMTDRGQRIIARDADIDRRAFMLYLRARGELRKEHSPETLSAAETLLEDAIDIDADFVRAWAGLCDTYLARYVQSGNEKTYFEKGERACQRALALESELAEVYTALGNLYRVSGNLDQATLEFGEALTLTPEYYDAVYGIAQTLEAQGNLEGAEAHLSELTRIEPGYWHGYNALGHFYYANSRYAEAAFNFGRVIALEPYNALALNNLGAAQYMQGDYLGAATAWEASVAIRPSHLVLSNVGLAAYYAGDFEKAAEMQRESISEAPEDYRIWGRLGDAERQLGDLERASAAYGEALRFASRTVELNPSNEEALRYLSLYYTHIGDNDAAIRAIERARELKPASSSVRYFASKVYLGAGDLERATRELDEALATGYSKELAEADPDLVPLRGPRTTKTKATGQRT